MIGWWAIPLELWLGGLALFYGCVTAGALLARACPRHRPEVAAPPRRFAVLLAAHDEENVVGEAIASLMAQRYEGTWQVFVVADRCGDRTAERARAAGAQVFERLEGTPSKGSALAWLWERIADPRWQAVVVMDADNAADPCFLAELDRGFRQGGRVLQGRRVAKNPHLSEASALDGWAEALHHRVVAAGLDWWGLSTTLSGSGLSFEADLFGALVRKTTTVVEDCEWQLELHRMGVAMRPAPRAVLYDEKVADFAIMARQRARWIHGKVRLWGRAWPGMLAGALRGRRGAWEGVLYLATMLPRSVLLAGLLGGGILALFRIPGWWPWPYWAVALALFGFYLGVGLAFERIGWRALLYAPRFMRVLLGACWQGLTRRQVPWQRTPHGQPGPPAGGPGIKGDAKR